MSSKDSAKNLDSRFKPIKLDLLAGSKVKSPDTRLTVTATIKGNAAEDFEKLMEETGLNKSQLLVQMVYHCVGRTEELKDFYRRIAILGE